MIRGVGPWYPDRSYEYDLFLAALGYETRSRYVAECLAEAAKDSVALGFIRDQVLAYAENRQFFSEHRFMVDEPATDASFRSAVTRAVANADRSADGTRPTKIVVDISSMTRTRLAAVVLECIDKPPVVGREIDFVYSLAGYTPPPPTETAISICEPVAAEFVGWPPNPEAPLVAICGLGYETDRALGAVEYLEAAEVWAFVPMGEVAEFGPALDRANRAFFDEIQPNHVVTYRLTDPYFTYQALESLTQGLREFARPLFVPLGPKLFALVTMIVALVNSPHTTVWRVSAEGLDVPVDRKPTGTLCGMRVRV